MSDPVVFISDKNLSYKSFIYFPVEKCGSQVFEGTFTSNLDDCKFRTRGERIKCELVDGHQPKDRIEYLKEKYGHDVISESFKFTFVRHPLDRFLSAYLAMSSHFGNPTVSLLESHLNDNWDGKEDLWVVGRSGLSIDEKIYRFNKFCSLFVFPAGDPHFSNYWHCLPTDLDDLDFVGKLETSDDDFEFICNKIFRGNRDDIEDSIKVYNMHKQRQTSHHSNYKREKLSFREFYTDESYELVSRMFSDEMEKFGYE
jgi:hypothetical protein